LATIKIKTGDCLESIAAAEGFDPEAVWASGENSELREKRGDPHVLLPDDELVLPEKEQRDESVATEQTHRFRRKGVPSVIRIRCLDEDGEPLKGWEYTLTLGSETIEGKLDGSGSLEIPVSPEIADASLILTKDDESFEWPLDIGGLDPADEISGGQDRLRNLGFECDTTGEMDDDTLEALHQFQATNDLPQSDEFDDATIDKLKELHDQSESGF